MITGTFIGSVADAWGRKFCAILYCVLYGLACLTKHVNVYGVLMLGRLLGGAATSLLFSTFECWMVGEHKRCGFPDDLLRYMFGLMFFVPWLPLLHIHLFAINSCSLSTWILFEVQYLAAIGAGWLAQLAASSMPLTPLTDSIWYGGSTTPFDLSLAFLLTALPAIYFLWQASVNGVTLGSRKFSATQRVRIVYRYLQISCTLQVYNTHTHTKRIKTLVRFVGPRSRRKPWVKFCAFSFGNWFFSNQVCHRRIMVRKATKATGRVSVVSESALWVCQSSKCARSWWSFASSFVLSGLVPFQRSSLQCEFCPDFWTFSLRYDSDDNWKSAE